MNRINTLAALAVAVAATGVALAAATYPAFDGTYDSTATGFVTNYAAISVVPEDHRFIDPDNHPPTGGKRYYYGKVEWKATPDVWAHSVALGVCTGGPMETVGSYGIRLTAGDYWKDCWRFRAEPFGYYTDLDFLVRNTNFHYIIKVEDDSWNVAYATLYINKHNQLTEPPTNGVDVVRLMAAGYSAAQPVNTLFVLNRRHYGSGGTELIVSDTASSLTWPGVPEPALCVLSVGLVALARRRR